MANAGMDWCFYVLENAKGQRYVGISEDVDARLAHHRRNVRSFLGKGQHRLIRTGPIPMKAGATKLQRMQTAVRVELLETVREWAAGKTDEQRNRIRGGPLPGERIMPRERPEITAWCKLFEKGEDQVKAKMLELQLSEGAPPPFWEKSASLAHLRLRCWRCGEVGHFSGNCSSSGKAPLAKAKREADSDFEAKLKQVDKEWDILAGLQQKLQAAEAEKSRKRRAAEQAVKKQVQQAKMAKLEAQAAEEASRRLPSAQELEEEEQFLRRLHERKDAMPKVYNAPVKPLPKRHYTERGSSTNSSRAAKKKANNQKLADQQKLERQKKAQEKAQEKEQKRQRAREGQRPWVGADPTP